VSGVVVPVGTAPGVDEPGRWAASALAAVLAAERAGIAVDAVAPGLAAPPRGSVIALRRHRLTTVVAPHADALGFAPDVSARLLELQRAEVAGGLANVVHARAASGVLAAAGVDHLIVKGVALSSAVGRGAAVRGRGDIDTWVRPGDLDVATEALAAAGWTRRPDAAGLPAVGSGWRWRLVERIGNEMALDHPERDTVDLHWRLTADAHELGFDFDEALEGSVALGEVGPTVRGLGPLHALAHVAQHARKEHYCILRQCLDVSDAAGVCDSDDVAALAGRDPNVALALAVAAPLAPWLGGFGAPGRREARLAAEVHAELGSLRWTHAATRAVSGAARMPSRWGRESWLVRSAPTRSVALRHVARSVVPLRLVVDDAPWRHRRHAGGA